MSISREELVGAFESAGHGLWEVGGSLRDELLGHPGHDADFATSATPEQVQAIAISIGADYTTVGQQFGTTGIHAGGEWCEITTFRGEAYTEGSRWPDVAFAATLEDDLARRDFTINAFARRATGGEIVDLFGGKADLAARQIRAVGDPATRFREDPLRILRGLRLASQLDFAIEEGTLAGMQETAALTATLSQERVTAELDRLLQGRAPGRALELLRSTGTLRLVLPELEAMSGCDQNRFHQFDVWGHTVATVAAVDVSANVRRRRWAALLHDLGKPAVRHIKPNGEWGFYGHEVVGAELAEELLERLRLGRRETQEVVALVRRHMDRPQVEEARSVRRFMVRARLHEEPLWEDLLALKRADNASHTYDDTGYHDALESACRAAIARDAELLRRESPLSGNDLVRIAGRPPGPWIKTVKDALGDQVLDGRIEPGDREAAERVARRLLENISPAERATGTR